MAPATVVIDCHPGFNTFSLGAMAAAHVTLVPVLLLERELTAFERMLREFARYPLAKPALQSPALGRLSSNRGATSAPALDGGSRPATQG